MAEQTIVKIKNEDDAWRALDEAFNDRLSISSDNRVEWLGWPVIRIYLPNVPEDATISTSMMRAILKLQQSMYRTHTLLSRGDQSLRTLTNIEREQFELRVKVEKGSSDLSINLPAIIAKYGSDVVAKMSGTELLIMVLGLALIYAGKLSYSEFLKSKTEQRKITAQDDNTKQLLNNFQSQLEHDSKRYELLTRVIEARPVLKQIEQNADDARAEIVRAVADENGGTVQGIVLPREVANEISSVSRSQSSEAVVKGVYRVAKVDTTVANGFRVTLEAVPTGEFVTASLFDAIISENHRTALQDAEWNKKTVFVELTGRLLHGRMIDAKIVDVKSHS